MRIVMFYHSLLSDWNHGNAHFLRGIASELLARGHTVTVYEPYDGWSVQHLIADHGYSALLDFRRAYPRLAAISVRYDADTFDVEAALDGADLALVHEWNEPALVSRIGRQRPYSRCRLLFHDTHHRSLTDPAAMSRFDFRNYDGVLAFGDVIRQQYLEQGWTERAWTWHEAADARVFRPMDTPRTGDVVWIGNWGDDERTRELQEFLVEPIMSLSLAAHVFGVRYPDHALDILAAGGINYGGWLPNYLAPETLARFCVTVHIPRRPYAAVLPGIPTIRPFEALACGIPLISAPWDDAEGLFRPGEDFLIARDGAEMKRHLRSVLQDRELARELSEKGRSRILERHTCSHRVDELQAILDEIAAPGTVAPAALAPCGAP